MASLQIQSGTLALTSLDLVLVFDEQAKPLRFGTNGTDAEVVFQQSTEPQIRIVKLAVGVIVVATKEGQNRFVGTNRMLLVFGALVLRIPIEYHKAGDSEFAVEAIEAVELILAAATHYRDAFAIVVVFDLVERVRQDQRLALTLNEHDLRSEEALCSFLRVARVLERVTDTRA